MSAEAPQLFIWDAEKSVMVPRRKSLADKTYVDAEIYNLAPVEERSEASHRAFFAAIRDAWGNLPDTLAERFPSSDHLRRYALIRTGFRNIREFACSSNAEALRLSAFLKGIDDYAVVVVNGKSVQMLTAKSMSYRAMPKDEFQRSKEAVLEYVSSLIGVEPKQLESAA